MPSPRPRSKEGVLYYSLEDSMLHRALIARYERLTRALSRRGCGRQPFSGEVRRMLNMIPYPGKVDEQAAPIWLDLFNPTEGERNEAGALMGVDLPDREALNGIETSNRLQVRDGVLFISIPMITRDDEGHRQTTPIGFVLSSERLATIRYAKSQPFEIVSAKFAQVEASPTTSTELLVDLFDAIVGTLADALEAIALEMQKISSDTFHVPDDNDHKAARSNKEIRARLRTIGRLGDHVSEIRNTLLNVGRAVGFACEIMRSWSGNRFDPRMATLKQDIASLDDYQDHLSDKTQFLLDAMVGLIGIAQNDIFKVLTIVSIVGIPPTLMAGIYGMNFKYMPEYSWALGYPFGLAVIAISAIIPLAWFKWRGWF